MNYDTLRKDADTIEVVVDGALDYVGEQEPIRSPLLNIRSAVKQLRDAINHAEGQER